jgi:hypothetical protein
VDDAWALTAALRNPAIAEKGQAHPRFSGTLAEPAVRPLLNNADPEVAETARETHASIEAVLQTDRLQKNDGP